MAWIRVCATSMPSKSLACFIFVWAEPMPGQNTRRVWFASGILCVLLVALPMHGMTRQDIWPGVQWQTATPQEAGMDPVLLASARDYALTGQITLR